MIEENRKGKRSWLKVGNFMTGKLEKGACNRVATSQTTKIEG
jgi:hypothetical protein